METWSWCQSHEIWVKFGETLITFNHVGKAHCSGIFVFAYLMAQSVQLRLYLVKYQCFNHG